MKGLFLKDFYMTVHYCKAYLLLVLVFAGASVFSDNLFLLIYPFILLSVIPVNLLSYDEKSRWTVYADCLPASRKKVVDVKYIVMLIFLAVTLAVFSVTHLTYSLVFGKGDLAAWMIMNAVLSSIGILSPSLMLPVLFKYGVEKGRMVYYLILILICGICGGLSANLLDGEIVVGQIGLWWAPAIVVAALLILAVSWILSRRFYENREL